MITPLLDHLTLLNLTMKEQPGISQAQSTLCSDMTMMVYHPMTVQYPSEPCTYTMKVSYPINCSW